MRLANLVAVLGALFLGACAAAAPEQCVVDRITEFPVPMTRDFALVPTRLDGHDAYLLLDTGAGVTMLSHDIADRLALMPEDRLFPAAVQGVGGVTLTRRLIVDTFEVGGIDLGKQAIMTTERGLFRDFDPPPDGIIGGDFLSQFDVDIDLPEKRVGLYRAHACRAPFAPPWPGFTLYRVPARLTDGGQFLIDVAVDGVPLVAMLDSGAEETAINARAMNKLGLTADTLAHDPVREERGIDMNRRLSHRHHFAKLKIGAETYRDPAIWVSDMPLLSADMLLGADFFQTHRLWLSFSRRVVFVTVSDDGDSPFNPHRPRHTAHY
ncbi:MAG: aspartyl protease family protein [Acidibrevibacterium sp.]|uniref:aspartyl protease family protein n=1 Tax=Acidibrevibacterium sp. TaxID=2606776 RepID=UPI003D01C918